MSRIFKTIVAAIAISTMCSCKFFSSAPSSVQLDVNAAPFKNLSDYGFFKGELKNLHPSEQVIPYSLLNTMFNDHARKKSFVYVPEGKTINGDEVGNFNFPEGSCLVNCVYFPIDERDENKGITLIETQLLIKTENEWKSLNYLWSDNQTDAVLDLTGDIKKVGWKDKNGSERSVDFVIAGKNQCKSCHNSNGQLVPIGVSAIGLNKNISIGGKEIHQLDYWKQLGLLSAGFEQKETAYINWQDKTQPLEKRVRAYLHINCAYCHSIEGPGKMSGLLLNYDNYNMETYGVCKSPPSAGKGSCNLKYDIVPGKPGESIIVCRMASTDLETKMPELGRTTTDNEGVSLIIDWILQMEGNCLVTETAGK
ncbi:MAG: hypothetical protein KIS94_14745 [Chitinophagales bacterium]|nr:hypothetical protein [Chitinophagales bacterium]